MLSLTVAAPPTRAQSPRAGSRWSFSPAGPTAAPFSLPHGYRLLSPLATQRAGAGCLGQVAVDLCLLDSGHQEKTCTPRPPAPPTETLDSGDGHK